jgi:DNA-binding FadR family transcriptional regulator
MIDPMVYGILLNQDSFENLMELREMTEVGMMRLAIAHHDEEELVELESIFKEMKAALELKENRVDTFFEADNRFHDKIAEMGKNPMADKINKVVRSLTYAVRYQTVAAMILGGMSDKLLDTHVQLFNAIKNRDLEDISKKVRSSYFEDDLG